MNSERWQRAKALFQAALEHPPETRAAFVESAVEHDEGLRLEVQLLLRADAAGVNVLDRLPLADAAVIAAGSSDFPPADGDPLEIHSQRRASHRAVRRSPRCLARVRWGRCIAREIRS